MSEDTNCGEGMYRVSPEEREIERLEKRLAAYEAMFQNVPNGERGHVVQLFADSQRQVKELQAENAEHLSLQRQLAEARAEVSNWHNAQIRKGRGEGMSESEFDLFMIDQSHVGTSAWKDSYVRDLQQQLSAVTEERDSESKWAEHYHRKAEEYCKALEDLRTYNNSFPYDERDVYMAQVIDKALAPADPVKTCGHPESCGMMPVEDADAIEEDARERERLEGMSDIEMTLEEFAKIGRQLAAVTADLDNAKVTIKALTEQRDTARAIQTAEKKILLDEIALKAKYREALEVMARQIQVVMEGTGSEDDLARMATNALVLIESVRTPCGDGCEKIKCGAQCRDGYCVLFTPAGQRRNDCGLQSPAEPVKNDLTIAKLARAHRLQQELSGDKPVKCKHERTGFRQSASGNESWLQCLTCGAEFSPNGSANAGVTERECTEGSKGDK